MKFATGQSVIVLDSENKPAGTGKVLSNDDGGSYKIAFTYNGSDKKEELIIPGHRLLINNDTGEKTFQISDPS